LAPPKRPVTAGGKGSTAAARCRAPERFSIFSECRQFRKQDSHLRPLRPEGCDLRHVCADLHHSATLMERSFAGRRQQAPDAHRDLAIQKPMLLKYPVTRCIKGLRGASALSIAYSPAYNLLITLGDPGVRRTGYEPGGREFESLRARQISRTYERLPNTFILFEPEYRGERRPGYRYTTVRRAS